MAIVVLSGVNSYALRRELRRRVDAFVREQGDMADMALERLDGEEASYDRLVEAMTSLPFLASSKMVVLSSPGANKQFMENISSLVGEVPDTTDLIIVEPKLDKRSAYYKFLRKQRGFMEFPELDENGLAAWLIKAAKEDQAKISSSDARYLISRVGANQQLLASELEKLILYAMPSDATKQFTIDRAAIDAVTTATPQSKIFDLLDAAFAGNVKRALQLYEEQRTLKVEPQQIIAMLAWQLHVIALVKAGSSSRNPDTIAKDAKMSPFVVRKSAAVAGRLTGGEIKKLVRDLLTIDARLKRESLNADDALQEYIISLAA
jgi:DNA polymerase-3 subunit delta